MASIDRLDARLLEFLTKNARAGVAEMGEALGVTRNTILSRLRRLEEAGVLRGFRPIIDLASIGMPVQALVSVELDQRLLAQIVRGLAALPEVLEVKIQAGREDLLVQVAIPSLEGLQQLTASIVAIDGVRKTTSTFSVATPVEYRVQPLLELVTGDRGWGRSTPSTRAGR